MEVHPTYVTKLSNHNSNISWMIYCIQILTDLFVRPWGHAGCKNASKLTPAQANGRQMSGMKLSDGMTPTPQI